MKPDLTIIKIACFLFTLALPMTVAEGKNPPQKCIMVFGAHADDVEIIAGGILARYISMGNELVYVNVINNLAGCNMERTPYYDEGPNFTISSSPNIYPVGTLETGFYYTVYDVWEHQPVEKVPG